MATIDKNDPPLPSEVNTFSEEVDFKLPSIEFFSTANGAEIAGAVYRGGGRRVILNKREF
ncbi:hypothetical protein M1D52_07225 [Olivibacter sp. SA151]|uniref:hypothetical protein n=1 Tax=Olivibacter jilunii TaxID=985016 RepID=UPI003F146EB4